MSDSGGYLFGTGPTTYPSPFEQPENYQSPALDPNNPAYDPVMAARVAAAREAEMAGEAATPDTYYGRPILPPGVNLGQGQDIALPPPDMAPLEAGAEAPAAEQRVPAPPTKNEPLRTEEPPAPREADRAPDVDTAAAGVDPGEYEWLRANTLPSASVRTADSPSGGEILGGAGEGEFIQPGGEGRYLFKTGIGDNATILADMQAAKRFAERDLALAARERAHGALLQSFDLPQASRDPAQKDLEARKTQLSMERLMPAMAEPSIRWADPTAAPGAGMMEYAPDGTTPTGGPTKAESLEQITNLKLAQLRRAPLDPEKQAQALVLLKRVGLLDELQRTHRAIDARTDIKDDVKLKWRQEATARSLAIADVLRDRTPQGQLDSILQSLAPNPLEGQGQGQ